jgi:hypothetical protein
MWLLSLGLFMIAAMAFRNHYIARKPRKASA